jgi:hypothetical protein
MDCSGRRTRIASKIPEALDSKGMFFFQPAQSAGASKLSAGRGKTPLAGLLRTAKSIRLAFSAGCTVRYPYPYRLLTFAAAFVVALPAGFFAIRCNRSASSRYAPSSLFCERNPIIRSS